MQHMRPKHDKSTCIKAVHKETPLRFVQFDTPWPSVSRVPLGMPLSMPMTAVLVAALSVSAHAAGPELADAQRAFFNARYQSAADLALELQTSNPDALPSYELRTSALHFQLRDALGPGTDKGKAFKACAACPDLLKAFLDTTKQGQDIARARLM